MLGRLCSISALAVLAGASLCGVAAAAEPAMPTSLSFFVVPRVSVGCFVSVPTNRLVCSRGRLTLNMGATGRPRKGPVRGWQPPPIQPDFLYLGNRWSDGDFTCVVRRSGLTCRNKSRHGWWFGKNAKYKVF